MIVHTPIHHQAPLRPVPSDIDSQTLRSASFKPPRRHWPGVLAATVLGAGIAAAFVSSYYDDRTMGTRLDDTVAAAESSVERGVSDLRGAATGAAKGTAMAADRVAGALNDTGITAAVKTALAADPSLSALKIEVNTTVGVVRLDGPAPDARARVERQTTAGSAIGV